MCGPQIRLCLFTFRPNASKQLNSLTSIVLVRWRGSAEVTHPLWVREVRVQITAPASVFMFDFCFVVVFYFCLVQKHILSQHFAISFAMLIYLVYLTYCKACDRLKGYTDTDMFKADLSDLFISYLLNLLI